MKNEAFRLILNIRRSDRILKLLQVIVSRHSLIEAEVPLE